MSNDSVLIYKKFLIEGPPSSRSADLAAALEGPRERHLVRVLQITPHRETTGDPRDPDPERPEELREVERRRLALDVGVRRQDDLGRLTALEPREELLDLEIVGADAVERREGAEQHMVAPAVLARPLHRQEVVRLLDDAEQARVPRGIGADATRILVGDVEAGVAGDNPVLHREERLRELAHLLDGALEQEEREPVGRLRSDAGQPLQRLDEPRDRCRVVRQAGRLDSQAGELEPAGELAELLLHELARLPERLVAGGEHEILEHLDVVAVHDLGIDLDRHDLLLAVRLDRHHAAARRRLHSLLADLFLHRGHLRLQPLRLLHEVPETLHWLSPSGRRGRTATTSPWNSATAAWTTGCAATPPAPSPATTTLIRSAPATCRRTACTMSSRFAVSASISRWKWFPVRTTVSSPPLTAPGLACVRTVPSVGRVF